MEGQLQTTLNTLNQNFIAAFNYELREYLLPRLPRRLRWTINHPRILSLVFKLRIVRRPTVELEPLGLASDGTTVRCSQRIRFR